MRIALAFAAEAATDQRSLPFRSPALMAALGAEGLQALTIHVTCARRDIGANPADDTSAEAADLTVDVHGLAALLATRRPEVVYTFGALADAAPVWNAAAQAECRIVHYVSGGPGETDGGAIRLRAWSLDGLRASAASHHVAGVLGSSRAIISHYMESGFFPRARFSMVALPPTAIMMWMAPARADASSPPVLGHCDESGDTEALRFLFDAVRLTGNLHLFRLVVASSAATGSIGSLPLNAKLIARRDPAELIRSIDVLVVPSSDDQLMRAALLALRANKIVIAPDGSAIGEALEYGRHGIPYEAGSSIGLAAAINEVVESWRNRPFDFRGVDAVIARTRPAETARVFARAAHKAAAESALGSAAAS